MGDETGPLVPQEDRVPGGGCGGVEVHDRQGRDAVAVGVVVNELSDDSRGRRRPEVLKEEGLVLFVANIAGKGVQGVGVGVNGFVRGRGVNVDLVGRVEAHARDHLGGEGLVGGGGGWVVEDGEDRALRCAGGPV